MSSIKQLVIKLQLNACGEAHLSCFCSCCLRFFVASQLFTNDVNGVQSLFDHALEMSDESSDLTGNRRFDRFQTAKPKNQINAVMGLKLGRGYPFGTVLVFSRTLPKVFIVFRIKRSSSRKHCHADGVEEKVMEVARPFF